MLGNISSSNLMPGHNYYDLKAGVEEAAEGREGLKVVMEVMIEEVVEIQGAEVMVVVEKVVVEKVVVVKEGEKEVEEVERLELFSTQKLERTSPFLQES